jgi:hypothetical protein
MLCTMVMHRRAVLAIEIFVAVAGLAGAVQLFAGVFTPPVSDVDPIGLTSWRLPAVWLFATTAAPSATAAWLVWTRSPRALVAVAVASALLVLELVVQIPFVGPSVLQAVMGTAAVAAFGLATWPRHSLPTSSLSG